MPHGAAIFVELGHPSTWSRQCWIHDVTLHDVGNPYRDATCCVVLAIARIEPPEIYDSRSITESIKQPPIQKITLAITLEPGKTGQKLVKLREHELRIGGGEITLDDRIIIEVVSKRDDGFYSAIPTQLFLSSPEY